MDRASGNEARRFVFWFRFEHVKVSVTVEQIVLAIIGKFINYTVFSGVKMYLVGNRKPYVWDPVGL